MTTHIFVPPVYYLHTYLDAWCAKSIATAAQTRGGTLLYVTSGYADRAREIPSIEGLLRLAGWKELRYSSKIFNDSGILCYSEFWKLVCDQ